MYRITDKLQKEIGKKTFRLDETADSTALQNYSSNGCTLAMAGDQPLCCPQKGARQSKT
jgi:hypothetical protein